MFDGNGARILVPLNDDQDYIYLAASKRRKIASSEA
jgi:hypothetical protein